MDGNPGPLDDLVVIEAGTMLSAGTVGRLFADFGADVVKIEHPTYRDPLRDISPQKDGVGLLWKYLARNKHTVTLDLGEPRGREVFLDLAAEADVVVENFRPGTFERWDLGYDVLSAANPDLVLARISGFGQTGPYADRPGFGTHAEALSGFAQINGFPDRPPLLPKTGFADGIAALFATFAIMFALYRRDHTGDGGQVVDTSLVEPLFNILGAQPLQYDQLGEIDRRTGNQSNISAPRNVYETADARYVALSGSTQALAERVFEAIGRPELIEDSRFEDNPSRVEHADELDAVIGDWIGERSWETVRDRFDEVDVPVAPVYDIADILADEHFRAREAVVTVDDDELGSAVVQNVTPILCETPGSVEYLGPGVGAANEVVYGEWLGYDETTLESLRVDGVI